jgi:hypothetical protein
MLKVKANILPKIFLYGAGGSVEAWATSCTTQIGNLDKNAIFQAEINDVHFSAIMIIYSLDFHFFYR